MRISAVVADLAGDLAALGALGDDAMADAARRLAAAMEGPLTARLIEVLGQVAAELDTREPDRHIEVRLVGDDAELTVAGAPPEPDPDETDLEGEADARISLRLSSALKARVEAASAREGVSVNTWIVRVLGQQARPERGRKTARRLTGYGRS